MQTNINSDRKDPSVDNSIEGFVASQIRIDLSEIPTVVETPEGYLKGESVVTRLGVFRYRNADGSERLELRHPDDILTKDSLDSLKMIPITVDHPAKLVDAKTVEELSVGMTGENYRIDGRHIITPISITHEKGINAIKNDGSRELSLGYVVDLIPEVGTYNGESYTHRQKNVRYNHLAIVSKARAGANARINMDGAAIQSDVLNHEEEVKMTTDTKLVQVNLDGLEYHAAPEVAKALTKLDADLKKERNDAEDTKKDMQAKIDGYQAKIDELTAEMEKMKESNNDSAIAEKVKARVELLSKASKVVKDSATLVDKTEREIMTAVITAKYDSLDLTGKSDDYVAARFDSIIDSLPSTKAVEEQVKKSTMKVDGQEKDVRADMIDEIKNQHKKGAK